MDENPRLLEVFFQVQRGLPRQGPGSQQATRAALGFCSDLPAGPDVLDLGCGPGMQTMVLAEASPGRITAVDTCDEYLEQLRQRVRRSDLADRVRVMNADMTQLGFHDASFDLIWCEAAIYNQGVSAALRAWRPMLREKGYLAFSELVWLEENPDAEVADFWREEYPAMTSVAANERLVSQAGYELVGGFTLPDSAWWADYYTPLAAKLPSLREAYAGDDEALGVIAMTETEISMRRRFGVSYGYHFFIARKAS